VLIFDLGGGTFDVSLLTLDGGVTEVKATAGDTRLGGEDFDVAVTKFLMSEAVASGMPDMSNDSRVMRRLQTAAEAAKRQLSQTEEAQIHVESLFSIARGTNTQVCSCKPRLTTHRITIDLLSFLFGSLIAPLRWCLFFFFLCFWFLRQGPAQAG